MELANSGTSKARSSRVGSCIISKARRRIPIASTPLEPSLTDPDTVYAGVEDAALFKTVDGGKTWHELPALRSAKGQLWQPGAGGMCLHTIALDGSHPGRMYVAISAAGVFRTD